MNTILYGYYYTMPECNKKNHKINMYFIINIDLQNTIKQFYMKHLLNSNSLDLTKQNKQLSSNTVIAHFLFLRLKYTEFYLFLNTVKKKCVIKSQKRSFPILYGY